MDEDDSIFGPNFEQIRAELERDLVGESSPSETLASE
jgi:hypothetical protein